MERQPYGPRIKLYFNDVWKIAVLAQNQTPYRKKSRHTNDRSKCSSQLSMQRRWAVRIFDETGASRAKHLS
jgi:hypothetical protein